MSYKSLPKSFFNKSTLDIAKGLLGKYIIHQTKEGLVAGKIVETEAYLIDDPASHSFNGETNRNKSMFMKAGTSYVYFTYGMYHCFNVVTNKEGVGEAVLIRALEPVEGLEVMKRNRGKKGTEFSDARNLCSGPAKLVIALGITKEHDGLDLLSDDSPLRLAQREKEKTGEKESFEIVETTRIGISKGASLPHRFYIKGSAFVSRK